MVAIFSAEDYAPILELTLEWSDVFDINVYPATSPEHGLAAGAEIFGRLARLQQ